MRLRCLRATSTAWFGRMWGSEPMQVGRQFHSMPVTNQNRVLSFPESAAPCYRRFMLFITEGKRSLSVWGRNEAEENSSKNAWEVESST